MGVAILPHLARRLVAAQAHRLLPHLFADVIESERRLEEAQLVGRPARIVRQREPRSVETERRLAASHNEARRAADAHAPRRATLVREGEAAGARQSAHKGKGALAPQHPHLPLRELDASNHAERQRLLAAAALLDAPIAGTRTCHPSGRSLRRKLAGARSTRIFRSLLRVLAPGADGALDSS